MRTALVCVSTADVCPLAAIVQCLKSWEFRVGTALLLRIMIDRDDACGIWRHEDWHQFKSRMESLSIQSLRRNKYSLNLGRTLASQLLMWIDDATLPRPLHTTPTLKYHDPIILLLFDVLVQDPIARQ